MKKRGEREEKIPLQREADRTTQGSEHQQQQTYRPPKADREENEERGGKRGNGIREKENGASMGSHGARDTKGVNGMCRLSKRATGADFERRRNARPGRKEGVSRRRESEHPLFHTERTNTAGKSPTLDNDRRGAGRN